MKYKVGDKVVMTLGSRSLPGVIIEVDESYNNIPYRIRVDGTAAPELTLWARERQVRLVDEGHSNFISNSDSYHFNIPEGYCTDWQLPDTEWEEEDTIVCECGATHTSFPDIHSTWCPMHEEQL